MKEINYSIATVFVPEQESGDALLIQFLPLIHYHKNVIYIPVLSSAFKWVNVLSLSLPSSPSVELLLNIVTFIPTHMHVR